MENVQVKLVKRPIGEPKADDFAIVRGPVPEPQAGQVLVEVHYLSLDPAMRGWMNEGKSYVKPVGLGEVMRALGVGRVIASADPRFTVGDYVSGTLGVQKYAVCDASDLTKVDPNLAPLPAHLHVLGMTGLTAYFGLLDVGRPQPGETVLVSAAAGAVGSLVGQIAKLKGCRVVGIAGGAQKCAYVRDELGFDAVIDYRHEDVARAIKTHCPKGVDIYFDNVGGEILDAALASLALRGRVVLCGAIAVYNATEKPAGPSNYLSLLINRGRMEGFIVFDYRERYPEAIAELATWLRQGKLKHREHIVSGIETFPERLLMLFRGENLGKLVLQVIE